MKKSKFLLLLALSLVLSAFLAGCYGGEEESGGATEGGDGEDTAVEQVLNVTESAEIPTMDSVMASDAVGFNVMNQVFEGLYRLDQNDQPTEGMATGYEVNEDETVFTFTLRDDATWSNGDPVVAEDFVYAWRKAVDPNTGSEYGPYMMSGVIKNATAVSEGEVDPSELGVTAENETTLVVELEKPTPYFLSLMTFPTFLPQPSGYVEEMGDEYALNSDSLVYNGPFVLSNWDGTGLSWEYEKNADYWDADNVALDTVNVQVVKEAQTGMNLYEGEEIDVVGLTAEYVTQYKDSPELQVEKEPTIFWLKMNQTKTAALANENIRRAITMAVDKEAMVNEILNNGSVAANYAIPAEFVSHPETGEDFRAKYGDFNTYDPEQAAKLFAQGLEEEGLETLEIGYLGGDSEIGIRLDEYVVNQLETNLEGLSINLQSVPFNVRLDLDTQMDYDLQNAGWGPDFQDAMTFANLWVTDGGNNMMGYSNPEYDALINQAENELAQSPVERFEALQEAERILLEEDAAIAPLYQRGVTRLVREKVEGLTPHAFGPDWSYKYVSISE